MRKRDKAIYFRLSQEEYDKLQELLNATGFTLSEFFRFNFLQMKAEPKPVVSKQHVN